MNFLLLGDVITYEVSVKTGDVRGAGTDANVHLYLYGKEGVSGKFYQMISI